jgi:hypothetical protein
MRPGSVVRHRRSAEIRCFASPSLSRAECSPSRTEEYEGPRLRVRLREISLRLVWSLQARPPAARSVWSGSRSTVVSSCHPILPVGSQMAGPQGWTGRVTDLRWRGRWKSSMVSARTAFARLHGPAHRNYLRGWLEHDPRTKWQARCPGRASAKEAPRRRDRSGLRASSRVVYRG